MKMRTLVWRELFERKSQMLTCFLAIFLKSEFQAKAAWGGAGIFSRPIGCGAIDTNTNPEPEDKKTLVRKRVIKDLESHEILIGPDVAKSLTLKEGDSMKLLGEDFSVIAVLPETGTVDD